MAQKKVYDYKKITMEDMKAYIEENAPQDKEWFKGVAIEMINNKPVYNHFKARLEFCERYMPEIIPVAKPQKEKKADILANW